MMSLKPPVTADVTFVVPDRRRRDMDNLLAMLKPAWDGLVDAGLLVDDSAEMLRLGAPKMRVEKGQQYVEVRLR
jgi:Holliday junction resolvase RusA-like endonuclease